MLRNCAKLILCSNKFGNTGYLGIWTFIDESSHHMHALMSVQQDQHELHVVVAYVSCDNYQSGHATWHLCLYCGNQYRLNILNMGL